MTSLGAENVVSSSPLCQWFKGLHDKLSSNLTEVASEAKKLGQEDPRRIIHSLKVGLAICLVSLLYYFDPLYEGFGISAIWAVITVVVVFEFTVGATIGRCLNRGLATFVGGGLGIGAHRIASFSGEKCEPMVLGLFVFLLAAMVTFVRFFTKMKARYDYGLLILILTFCLICVSGYRDDEVLDMARTRLSTILIGAATSLTVCFCIRPVWAGHNLHNLVASNLEKLGKSLEGFGDEATDDDRSIPKGYKDVLRSKNTEESLANFAKWEPRHGRFRYRHPWDQYLKIGDLSRECARRIEVLGAIFNSDIQSEATSPEFAGRFKEAFTTMSTACSHVLKELSRAITTMTWPSSPTCHVGNLETAAGNLKSFLQTDSCPHTQNVKITPLAATLAFLLLDAVVYTEKIAKSVAELASEAKFKKAQLKDAVTREKRGSHVDVRVDSTPSHGPGE
ncbi:hypothetical protein NMG60_11033448 [Bertholletia excelsa]